MDDLHRRECEELAARAAAKLHPDEFRAITALARADIQERMDEMQSRMHDWLTEIVTWLTQPYSEKKKWGMIYSLDLPLHDERNIAETARIIGCTRAAISGFAQQFAKTFKVMPSRWLRDDEAVEHSREAREGYCEPL
jgi:hypothetical protein